MNGQRKTLIPSTLDYIPLAFYQTDNTELKLIRRFDATVYTNIMDSLS